MSWLLLVVAGIVEIVWAYAMKQSDGFTRIGPSVVTVIGMIASFGMLSLAMRSLPLGTAYTIWTGIGAVGAFLIGITLLGESASPLRIAAAVLTVSGLILMKRSSNAQHDVPAPRCHSERTRRISCHLQHASGLRPNGSFDSERFVTSKRSLLRQDDNGVGPRSVTRPKVRCCGPSGR
jgi:quaternary ammonium compound-resistance protein SugE